MTAGPWVITIPKPGPWLSDNDRLDKFEKARRVKPWREAAYYAALKAKPPKDINLVRVDTLFRYAVSPVEEISNLRPTLKAIVDGAVGRKRGHSVGYGIVVADSDRHVKYGSYEFELIEISAARLKLDPHAGEVVLTITDLSAGVAA